MKKRNSTVSAIMQALSVFAFIVLGFLFPVSAGQQTITVSGIVVDSTTKQPIADATILLSDVVSISLSGPIDIAALLNSLELDTVFSKTDGKFSYSMKINASSQFLLYGIMQQGYTMEYSLEVLSILGQPIPTSVSLDTIKLKKNNENAPKDTLVVSGTTIDSATGLALSGCRITLSGLPEMDTSGNSIISGADGAFSKQIIIASSLKTLVYIVEKDGFEGVAGDKQYTTKQINVGIIKLRKSNAAILPAKQMIYSKMNFDKLMICSLNGRLLRSEAVRAFENGNKGFSGVVVTSLIKNGKRLQNNRKMVLLNAH